MPWRISSYCFARRPHATFAHFWRGLFISPQLRWGLSLNVPLFTRLGMVEFAPYAIPFAGAAAYFICFRPGSHPVRRLFWWVCFPALVVLVAECCFYIYLA